MNYILPMSLVFGILNWCLIGKWYVFPKLRTLPLEDALIPLLIPHLFRYVGMAFLIPGVTRVALDPRFANPAAFGDLLTAILALVAIFALKNRWVSAKLWVWLFSIEGTLDFIIAVSSGLLIVPPGDFGAMYLIPVLVVPILVVSHVLIFILLIRKPS